jgi:hypothetical protein
MDAATRRFVLVPVPAPHVLDVMRWLVYKDSQSAGSAEWDEEKLRALLAALTVLPKAVIAAVAEASMTAGGVRVRALATELHAEIGEVTVALQDIRRRCREQKLPDLIAIHQETEFDEDGGEQSVLRLEVSPDVASMLVDLET